MTKRIWNDVGNIWINVTLEAEFDIMKHNIRVKGEHRIMFESTYELGLNPYSLDDSDLTILFSGQSQTKPLHKIGPRVYDYYLIHYILQGKGTFVTEGISYPLRRGDSFIIQPEQLVSYQSDESAPWKYVWVAFKGDGCEKLLKEAEIDSSPVITDSTLSNDIPNLMHSIRHTFQKKEAFSHLKAKGYLYLLLAEYREKMNGNEKATMVAKQEPPLVKQIIHYLSSQYTYPVSIAKMAEDLGYHRAYLSRIFKQETGMAPSAFLQKLRIDKGKQLLRERHDLTIEQVAYSVGLHDPLYFSRQFRRHYHLSPSQYRQQFQEG